MPVFPSSSTVGLKLKTLLRFPYRVIANSGIQAPIENGVITFGLDYPTLTQNAGIPDPSLFTIAALNTGTGEYEEVPLSDVPTTTTGDVRTPRGDAVYVILNTDRYVALTATLTAARAWTLPAASSVSGGTRIVIQDEAGGISSTNTITVGVTGADTINGASTFVLNAARSGIEFRSDGTSKWSARLIGATELADASVATAKVVDNAITNAKAAQMAATTVKGNGSGSTANAVDLTISTGLTSSSTTISVDASYMRGALGGLTLANNSGTPNTIYDIAAGFCCSDDATVLMKLASGYTKTTGAWAVGTGNGSLDTGSVANSTWYHVFIIQRPDTGVVDVLLSTSATAPTMPTNYTKKRRIGSIRTNGSAQILAFTQFGDEFIWKATVADIGGAITSTTSALAALTVPLGVQVEAKFRSVLVYAGGTALVLVQSPSQNTESTSTVVANYNLACFISGEQSAVDMSILTNTASQVRYVGNGATGSFYINTYGWSDTRGRFS